MVSTFESALRIRPQTDEDTCTTPPSVTETRNHCTQNQKLWPCHSDRQSVALSGCVSLNTHHNGWSRQSDQTCFNFTVLIVNDRTSNQIVGRHASLIEKTMWLFKEHGQRQWDDGPCSIPFECKKTDISDDQHVRPHYQWWATHQFWITPWASRKLETSVNKPL
jgi:hypothetical protein